VSGAATLVIGGPAVAASLAVNPSNLASHIVSAKGM
jgi:hypothetical protein